MTKAKPDVMLWLDDHRGQYIPRDFALSFANRARDVSGVTDEQWAVLERGPFGGMDSVDGGSDDYWGVWCEVESAAVVTDDNGVKYRIYNDGACWLVPEGMEWNEDEDFFAWPSEDEDAA